MVWDSSFVAEDTAHEASLTCGRADDCSNRKNDTVMMSPELRYRCSTMECRATSSFGRAQRCCRAAWPQNGRTSQTGGRLHRYRVGVPTSALTNDTGGCTTMLDAAQEAVEEPAVDDADCIGAVVPGAAKCIPAQNESDVSLKYDCQMLMRWRHATPEVASLLDSSRLKAASKKRRKAVSRTRTSPTWEVPLLKRPGDRSDSPDIKAELKKLNALRQADEGVSTDQRSASIDAYLLDSGSPASSSSTAVVATPDSPHCRSLPSRVASRSFSNFAKWSNTRERSRERKRTTSPEASTTTGGETPTSLLSAEESSMEQQLPRSKPAFKSQGDEQSERHPINCTCSSCKKMRTFIGLLNKISWQNEMVIVEQLSFLAPCNKQEQRRMAELIIQQALRDPLHGDLYGRTILALSIVFPQFPSVGLDSLHWSRGEMDSGRDRVKAGQNKRAPRLVSFAAQVVRCCQDEFERFCRELQDLDAETRRGTRGDVEVAATLESLEAGQQVKDRALACAKVIAKLVLSDVLSARLLVTVLVKLLWTETQVPGDLVFTGPPASFIEFACELLSAVVGPLRWAEREPEALQGLLDRLAELKDLRAKGTHEARDEGAHRLSRYGAASPSAFVYPTRVRYIVLNLLEDCSPGA